MCTFVFSVSVVCVASIHPVGCGLGPIGSEDRTCNVVAGALPPLRALGLWGRSPAPVGFKTRPGRSGALSVLLVCVPHVAELSRGVVDTFSKLGADLGFGAPIRPLVFEHCIVCGHVVGVRKTYFLQHRPSDSRLLELMATRFLGVPGFAFKHANSYMQNLMSGSHSVAI